MADTSFSLSDGDLRALVTQALDIAREMGASAAEADLSESFGQSVTVRMREVETIEYTRDKDFGVTVYFGNQRGHASSSDMLKLIDDVRERVRGAYGIELENEVIVWQN